MLNADSHAAPRRGDLIPVIELWGTCWCRCKATSAIARCRT